MANKDLNQPLGSLMTLGSLLTAILERLVGPVQRLIITIKSFHLLSREGYSQTGDSLVVAHE